jgi:hypothetical protein
MEVSGQLHALVTLPLRVGCVGPTHHSREEKYGIQNYNWKIRRKRPLWRLSIDKSVMDEFFWLMIGPSDRLL